MYAKVRGSLNNGHPKLRPHSVSGASTILATTGVAITRRIITNQSQSDDRSVVFLGRPLPFLILCSAMTHSFLSTSSDDGITSAQITSDPSI